ncbi:OmpA family protein [Cerasicoccus arenae]|uniref:OmpA-like domain-containing protein n=1 Tax=Cerasicoccus arenae TaxID=424488 RepID=A0A8J3GDP3_9BACT|nr:OmpA family protein [Cerasicoccus arenae]MBK1859049.1 OmpA family protein [Cerasicoccus arenae]GHC03330.1 hypothetical protein GCM10007047_19880 [Cerasicoccus arenae]
MQNYVGMFRVFNFAFISFAFVLLFSGCSDTEPKPGDTVLGSPKRPGDGGIPINYEDIGGGPGGGYTGGDLDLTQRDTSFNTSPDSMGGIDGLGGGQNVMDSVYFGFDQSSVPPAERYKVDAAADYLRSNPGAKLIAEGHTDAVGTTEYNNGLSDRRANSVKTYLEQLGIPGDRVEVLAMGEIGANESAAKGSPESAHDRRVDLIQVK